MNVLCSHIFFHIDIIIKAFGLAVYNQLLRRVGNISRAALDWIHLVTLYVHHS